MALDRIDIGILQLLQNDASLSNKEVARRLAWRRLAPTSG